MSLPRNLGHFTARNAWVWWAKSREFADQRGLLWWSTATAHSTNCIELHGKFTFSTL